MGHLGDSCCEAFHRDLELVQCIRQTYFRTHALTFHKEDTYELMEVFKELADMAGLLGTEVYPVQDPWVGKRELCCTYYAVTGSAKDLPLFQDSGTPQIPQNNGSPRHTLPRGTEATGWPLILPWCRKEGQNKGTIVNHLCTRHYCLGLVCERSLSYFTTTSDKMQCHAKRYPCMPSHKGNLDGEAEKHT